MGWTYTTKPSTQSVAEFFEQELCGGPYATVVACSTPSPWTAYLAIRYGPAANETERRVFATVCLLDVHPAADDTLAHGLRFGYKDIDERMGPLRYDCPQQILDLLSPTDNPYALAWREECRRKAG